MPKKVNQAEAKEKWNFYFPKLLKLEMHHKLLDMDLQNKQSALLRALVRMFVNNQIDNEILIELIRQESYITPAGKISKL